MRRAFPSFVAWQVAACVLAAVVCLIPTVARTGPFWGYLRDWTSLNPDRVRIHTVEPDSPAHAAGLLPGDWVVAVNGHNRVTAEAFDELVKELRPGSDLRFRVERGEKDRQVLDLTAVAWQPQVEAVYVYQAQLVVLLVCVALAVFLVITGGLEPAPLWRPLTVLAVGFAGAVALLISLHFRWTSIDTVRLYQRWLIDNDPPMPRWAIQGVSLTAAVCLVVLGALEARGCLRRRRDGGADGGVGDSSLAGERTEALTGPVDPQAPGDLARLLPQLEVIELVGRGGMGVVYKARQRRLDRLAALKVLPPEAGRDPSFANRFEREAKAMARLNHPGVIALYDFGEAGGLHYLLMEFAEGGSLRRRMSEGPVGAAWALGVAEQVCAALQYAHERGVVHRDLKPENILLQDGRVKIADFGLAKLLDASTGPGLTASRQVLGTYHYMAPEQFEAPLQVDHRADLYAVGVVLYELLTGVLPRGHFTPPSQQCAVDAGVDAVVMRALEREPARRFQSAAEMAAALGKLGAQP